MTIPNVDVIRCFAVGFIKSARGVGNEHQRKSNTPGNLFRGVFVANRFVSSEGRGVDDLGDR
jgi:hypothetical protein